MPEWTIERVWVGRDNAQNGDKLALKWGLDNGKVAAQGVGTGKHWSWLVPPSVPRCLPCLLHSSLLSASPHVLLGGVPVSTVPKPPGKNIIYCLRLDIIDPQMAVPWLQKALKIATRSWSTPRLPLCLLQQVGLCVFFYDLAQDTL